MAQSTDDPASPGEVTRLLAAARQGDASAMDRLMAVIYDELRAVARRQLRRRRPGQTLDSTALVHEAWLKLGGQAGGGAWQDRAHFLSVAGVAMRHILVDAARRRAASKRGGEDLRVTFDELRPARDAPEADAFAVEVLDLDRALTALAALDERLGRLVELRFFAGLTEDEAAEALGTSGRTVRRDWRKARAFLSRFLGDETAG